MSPEMISIADTANGMTRLSVDNPTKALAYDSGNGIKVASVRKNKTPTITMAST